MQNGLMVHPRRLGIVAATVATGAGLAFMAAADAPRTYLVINVSALAIGVALLGIVARRRGDAARGSGGFILAAGLGLLATAQFGTSIEGVARWVRIGGVTLQPGLILLPLMILAYARCRDMLATAGMLVAALALALQPDRALAAAQLAGLAIMAWQHRETGPRMALMAAAAGFAASLLRADTLPATPFVEQVFAAALAFAPLAGGCLIAAAALLLLPALARGDSAPVFIAVWVTILLAAVLGNYPTPLLGYGGSGILGYLLGLSALPGRTARDGRAAAVQPMPCDSDRLDRLAAVRMAR
jgi:hypothetical protein